MRLGSKANDTTRLRLGTLPEGNGAVQVSGSGGYLSTLMNASRGFGAVNPPRNFVVRTGSVPGGNNGEFALFNNKGDATVEANMLHDG